MVSPGAAIISKISIHAPREGSDECPYIKVTWGSEFQSTLPARGATNFSEITSPT